MVTKTLRDGETETVCVRACMLVREKEDGGDEMKKKTFLVSKCFFRACVNPLESRYTITDTGYLVVKPRSLSPIFIRLWGSAVLYAGCGRRRHSRIVHKYTLRRY